MNSSALPEFKVEGAVIHLLGAPGTGKYTIAQEMLKLCDIRLVDNHLINNPLFSLVRLDGKTPLPARIWDNVIKIWDAVADTMVHISPREFSFVLTNGLFEGDDEDRKHMLNMKRVADERGGIYVPVRLVISDVEEHIRRITADSRSARMKETDPAAPHKYASREVLKTGLATELTLDVTSLAPVDAARKILAHAQSLKTA